MEINLLAHKDVSLMILSYLDNEMLFLLGKRNRYIKELMTNAKLWALKLTSEYDIDILKYKIQYNIHPPDFKDLYVANQKLIKITESDDIYDNFFDGRTFTNMIYTVVDDVDDIYRVTETEAKYMLILLGMDYMLDLKVKMGISWITGRYKVPSFKDILIIAVALEYTGTLLQKEEMSFPFVVTGINEQYLEKDVRPDLIYIMMTMPNEIINEIAKNFLTRREGYVFKVRKYLKEKGYQLYL